MPKKARSKVQLRYLRGVASGSVKSPSLTPAKAAEMVGHQSPKGLPEKVVRKQP